MLTFNIGVKVEGSNISVQCSSNHQASFHLVPPLHHPSEVLHQLLLICKVCLLFQIRWLKHSAKPCQSDR